jgi:hypothetical protein
MTFTLYGTRGSGSAAFEMALRAKAKAMFNQEMSLSSRWPSSRPIRSRRTVTGLSAITCDLTRKSGAVRRAMVTSGGNSYHVPAFH